MAYVGDSLIWCGWKFNFAYETVELCAAKRAKLSMQIQGLLSKPTSAQKRPRSLHRPSHVGDKHKPCPTPLLSASLPPPQ